ncbi:uncharacterized protein A1O9_05518 [Exophiala aquamarina CBS 119918]|uniref:Peptidase S54 rhomboid domain-containing protein n=1 Tax=Exophiala aquamarina CBS 119918 TaxID=1182545 RepID=A0A072PQ03_9EURO|nr:uncharacterized protein A1O9_05518 [Exophiala aquamarina CBS 119918]KEF57600.1 hypothetical protein A1O9_05518 [Exophiala aquamarina CBS 119918]
MVTTSGFSHAPVTRFVILLCISTSILTSILDVKHYLAIRPTPHLWPYVQFSRILTFQAAYTSSVELLFSTTLLYQFRVLERLWGSRKYASFLFVCFWLNVLLLPALVVTAKVWSLGVYNYLPSGLTAVVYACLSAWADEIPQLYRYKIITASPSSSPRRAGARGGDGDGDGDGAESRGSATGHSPQQPAGIVLSDKSTTYLIAAQLALSQFPYQLLPAAVGWTIGTAWMGELLPGGLGRWRVPSWLVGETSKSKERGQFEGLRRRLEEEGSSADGMRNVSDSVAAGSSQGNNARRGFGRQVLGYFTGS